mgnify:FL=1
MKDDDSAGVKSSHETAESTILTDGGSLSADRWPSATEWVRVDDDGTQTWCTSRGHRERRRYER